MKSDPATTPPERGDATEADRLHELRNALNAIAFAAAAAQRRHDLGDRDGVAVNIERILTACARARAALQTE